LGNQKKTNQPPGRGLRARLQPFTRPYPRNVNEGIDMNYKVITALSVLTVAVLAGCNHAKSPDIVANNIAATQQKADENIANAQKDASKNNVSAIDKVDDKRKDLNNVEAKGTYDVALARAERNHEVALEKCNAVSGDAQSKCKDMAAADYDATKADAKASEVSSKQ
jgi:hypothetical protein